jgi:hypothetical protein
MIHDFLAGKAGPFLLFLVAMGAIWLWNLWDCVRNPRRPPPLRWYHFTDTPPADRWDLDALERDYVEATGERKAETRPGSCPR